MVVVVSEETASISVVMGGEIAQNLAAPKLREVLSEIMGGDRRDLPPSALEAARPPALVAGSPHGSVATTAESAG